MSPSSCCRKSGHRYGCSIQGLLPWLSFMVTMLATMAGSCGSGTWVQHQQSQHPRSVPMTSTMVTALKAGSYT